MKLLKSIQEQTQQFKVEFLTKYEAHVRKEFEKLKEKYTINTVFDQIQQETGVRNIYHTRKEYLRAKRIQDILFDFEHNRIDTTIKKELDREEKSFEMKQMKLAERLERAGVCENIEVVVNSSYPNLEGHVNVDGIRVKTFYTIVAEGPIQRPHFRYLIK